FTGAASAALARDLSDVPERAALAAAGAAAAWLVAMSGWLLRPYAPERLATARALDAVAGLSSDGTAAQRHRAALAVQQAWHRVDLLPAASGRRGGARVGERLRVLVVRAETRLHDAAQGAASDGALLREA